MLKNIIIAHLYQSGTAATNRVFAYAKSFSALGKNVVLVLGVDKESNLDDKAVFATRGVKVKMVHEKHGYRQLKAMAETIRRNYIKGCSSILVYGSPALCWFLPKSKYNIFFECTEVPLYGRAKGIVTRLKERIKLFLAKRATGMLVISKALDRYYAERGIKDIAIINMFVDVTRFDIQVQYTGKKYIAYCGTISPFKDGVDCLIKAFNIFHKTHLDYKLMIVGRFESVAAERQIKTLVNELSIADNIVFTGIVSSDKMPYLLCGAQMLALARPNNEQAKYGFPTKLGEYLATGNPVVVTNVGEIGDFLSDGVNCRMAKPDNPGAFADCLSWVADHLEEAKHLGIVGRKLTLSEFSCVEQSKRVIEFMSKTSTIKR